MRVVVGELTDVFRLQATYLASALGRPLQSAFAQGLKTHGVILNVVVVQPIVGDEFVHQRQCKRRVGARSEGQMHIAFVGGFGSTRVYAHQLGALAFRLLRDAPKMHAAGDDVAAPNEDEFGLREMLHLHAYLAAKGLRQGFAASARANCAVEFGSTQQVEKPHGDGLALHHAHGACIAVGQDALRMFIGNGFQTCGDVAQGCIPTDPLELATALGAHAFHRVKHPIGVVGAFGVARHLGAQYAIRQGVVGVALHLDCHPVLHGG